MTVWRLVTNRFVATAFNGEGAKRFGGRWNRKGVPVVYTASSQSLAMLEMLVQDNPLRARYMMIPVLIPDATGIERVNLSDLPEDWRNQRLGSCLQAIGSDWAKQRRSAVLAVPSAVIPDESNYLLNPEHPEFGTIVIGAARELVTDLRLRELATRPAPTQAF